MTRLQMQQKLLSFGDDYTVKDESGRDLYFVDGKVFTLRDMLEIQDTQGNQLVRITRRILAWGPTYEIARDGETIAVVQKRLFTFFHCRFTVDVPGPDDLEAKGDFFEYEYEFKRHGRCVATVSKRFFAFRDTYGLEFDDGEDPVLLLAAAVVIDQCCHEKR
ncbi:MAG: LURP-one-related family protein [Planctomycetota bacterium]